MKKFFTLLTAIGLIFLFQNHLFAQDIYWHEGFNNSATGSDLNSSSSSANMTTPIPTWDMADSGQWCLYGVYRTTGSACANYGPGHLRHFKYSSGTYEGITTFAVSPVVNYGIATIHFTPVATGTSGKHFVLEWTPDTSALTTNWTIFQDSSKTIMSSCLDTSITINQVSAKRIRFRIATNSTAGYQIEYDSVYFLSMNPIPVPVSFSAINANYNNGVVKVSWSNELESSLSAYAIERSTDGSTFSTLGTINAIGAKNYSWIDNAPVSGEDYYRIRAIGNNGTITYSSIVKVNTLAGPQGIAVVPNPVTTGILNLQLNNLAAGSYEVHLINSAGQVVLNTKILSVGGSSVQSIGLSSSIAKGIYTVLVTNGSSKFTAEVVVE